MAVRRSELEEGNAWRHNTLEGRPGPCQSAARKRAESAERSEQARTTPFSSASLYMYVFRVPKPRCLPPDVSSNPGGALSRGYLCAPSDTVIKALPYVVDLRASSATTNPHPAPFSPACSLSPHFIDSLLSFFLRETLGDGHHLKGAQQPQQHAELRVSPLTN